MPLWDPWHYLLPLALPTLVPAPTQGFPSSHAGSYKGIPFLHKLGNRKFHWKYYSQSTEHNINGQSSYLYKTHLRCTFNEQVYTNICCLKQCSQSNPLYHKLLCTAHQAHCTIVCFAQNVDWAELSQNWHINICFFFFFADLHVHTKLIGLHAHVELSHKPVTMQYPICTGAL